METIEQAKQFLRANYKNGVNCPCCGLFVKRYKRKINSSMAYGCILLTRHLKVGDVFHIGEFFKPFLDVSAHLCGDIAKLRYWNLIEKIEGERSDGSSRIGYYKITKELFLFVNGDRKVASHVYLFDNKILGYSDDYCNIKQALGAKFNYDELMNS